MPDTTKKTPARVTSDVVKRTITVAGTVSSSDEASDLVSAVIAASDSLYKGTRIVLDVNHSFESALARSESLAEAKGKKS